MISLSISEFSPDIRIGLPTTNFSTLFSLVKSKIKSKKSMFLTVSSGKAKTLLSSVTDKPIFFDHNQFLYILT